MIKSKAIKNIVKKNNASLRIKLSDFSLYKSNGTKLCWLQQKYWK